MSVKGAESYTRPIVSLSHKQQMLVVDMYVSSLHLHVEGHVFSFALLEEYVLPNAEIVHPCFLSFCTLSELYVFVVCIMTRTKMTKYIYLQIFEIHKGTILCD